VRISACGVCRTDLHVVDGELSNPKLPLVPGHKIVGRIDAMAPDAEDLRIGMRVGIPWLGFTCGTWAYCARGQENLCDRPLFTGYTRDGGYATHVVADARFVFPLPPEGDDVATAPLLCAGLIGWRSLRMAGEGRKLGLYSFGAAAHIIAQVARWQGREVFAFTKPGDTAGQDFARALGACWASGSDAAPPEPLDCAIIFAPVGSLIPAALKAVRKGGRVVCAGIHMSDIPGFPYRLLWGERQIRERRQPDARGRQGILPPCGSSPHRHRDGALPAHNGERRIERLAVRPPSGRGGASPLRGAETDSLTVQFLASPGSDFTQNTS
jgi:alcohol dehydrogenase, propanol-preferring